MTAGEVVEKAVEGYLIGVLVGVIAAVVGHRIDADTHIVMCVLPACVIIMGYLAVCYIATRPVPEHVDEEDKDAG